ncbi:hypothetical protein OIO90_004860 [Microbotryomycetes sp. JL221]|nr:hypothetical protein OIO90_004860 [Microbotryomycetes sp. JL221]
MQPTTQPRQISDLLANLPVEILERIIKLGSELEWELEDLHRLGLASRDLAQLVKPFKYHSLSLPSPRAQDLLDVQRHLLAGVGPYIRNLTVHIFSFGRLKGLHIRKSYSRVPVMSQMVLNGLIREHLGIILPPSNDPVERWRAQYEALMHAVLAALPNLQTLAVGLPYRSAGYPRPDIRGYLRHGDGLKASVVLERLTSPLQLVSGAIEELKVEFGNFGSQVTKLQEDVQRFQNLRSLSLTGLELDSFWNPVLNFPEMPAHKALEGLSSLCHLRFLCLRMVNLWHAEEYGGKSFLNFFVGWVRRAKGECAAPRLRNEEGSNAVAQSFEV